MPAARSTVSTSERAAPETTASRARPAARRTALRTAGATVEPSPTRSRKSRVRPSSTLRGRGVIRAEPVLDDLGVGQPCELGEVLLFAERPPYPAKSSRKIAHCTRSSSESVPLKSKSNARTGLGSRMRVEEAVERLWPGQPVEVEPLGGGITNHNFKVVVGGDTLVLRIGGKDTELLGIDREHEHEAAVLAAELGIGPEVAGFDRRRPRHAIRRRRGRTRRSERRRRAAASAALRPPDRRALRLVPRGRDLRSHRTASTASLFPSDVRARTRARAADRVQALDGPRSSPATTICSPPTSSTTAHRLWIVDWEYAGMGDPFFDLGELLGQQRARRRGRAGAPRLVRLDRSRRADR